MCECHNNNAILRLDQLHVQPAANQFMGEGPSVANTVGSTPVAHMQSSVNWQVPGSNYESRPVQAMQSTANMYGVNPGAAVSRNIYRWFIDDKYNK